MSLRVSLIALIGVFVLCAFAPLTHAQTAEERAALQAQLDQIEKDIANNQGSLSVLQQQRTTLERDIKILDNKIKTAQLQIKQTDLSLKQIGSDIAQKKVGIAQVDANVAKGQRGLAEILRQTREIDETPIASVILSSQSISETFREIDNFQTLQASLKTAFEEMAALRTDLSERKAALEDKQEEQQTVRTAQVIAKQAVESDEKQKQNILTVTKGQEKTYQQLIADKQKQAAAIRAALFGLRDSGSIPFGTAYQYAKEAEAETGVAAALTLAILKQETNLGSNIGSCYVTNLETGAGKGKNTGRAFSNVMKAPRDTVPFKEIADALGLDWSTEPVSCPQSIGYGGAMGAAQFIPSTWMLYKDRLSKLTGTAFPNPWNARTAIFATALLMKDNGAAGGTRSAERTAALKYFAGGNWAKASSAPYGDNVMSLRDDIQENIDVISGS